MKARNILLVCVIAAGVPLAAQSQPKFSPQITAALKVCATSTAPPGPMQAQAISRMKNLTPAMTAMLQSKMGAMSVAKAQANSSTLDSTLAALALFGCLRDEGIKVPPGAEELKAYLKTQ